MSEQIDWSKAPEGADKYNAHNSMFYKGERPDLQVFWDGRWKPSAIIKSNELFVYRPTNPSWSGEGLPPVGVVCEVNPDKAGWRKSVISYVGDGFIAWMQVGDLIVPEYGAFIDDCEFRPIRTHEQIASDEREAAVDEMHELYMEGAKHSGGLYALYDAGYRKEQK